MTAATITARIAKRIPNEEVVVLTASDGETFTSEKFASVLSAGVSVMEDCNTPVSCSVSGAVVTIHGTSVTDKLVRLIVEGKLGN